MNFYMIEKTDEKKAPELLSSIKQFLKERLSGAIEDPVLQLASGGNNPFFLKTQAGIHWVRVFEEALTLQGLPALRHDLERVSQMFRQKVRFYLFAPGYSEDFNLTTSQPHDALFFEYFPLKSRFGQGVALRERKIDFQEKSPLSPAPSSGRLCNARLERDELSELINLSLDLKGLGPAGI